MVATSQPYSRPLPRAAQALAALILGFGAFLAFVVVWTLGYQLLYAGRIFPGVTVAGVDLSGLAPADAAVKLNQALTFPLNGKILFREGGNIWLTSPMELGMVFDASASAQAAYRLGRSGNPLAALFDQLDARQSGAFVRVPCRMYLRHPVGNRLEPVGSSVRPGRTPQEIAPSPP